MSIIDEPMKAKTVSRHGAYPRIDRYCPKCMAFLFGKEHRCHSCGQLIRYKGEKNERLGEKDRSDK